MNTPQPQGQPANPANPGSTGYGKSNSPSATLPAPIVSLRGVSKRFGERHVGPAGRLLERAGLAHPPAVVHAVDNVDLIVKPGEVVGLVGESGCGKSTLGRMLAGLLKPSSGEVQIHGRPAQSLNVQEQRDARLKIQMIFQDPYASLNPRLRIDRIVGEGALVHGLTDRAGFDDYVSAQLQRAGLDPALRHRYPHQFSGGQRQRIGIARALAVNPDLLVCDEAVAALDVSIQAQILNLFMDLREQLRLTYVFISHDLGVVEHLSDRVVIMYLGRIVESAPVEEVFRRPNHPYTQALLAEIPRIDVRHKTFSSIRGEIPSPIAPPSGCHFHPRCPHAMPRCRTEVPTLRGVAINHVSACHLNDA
ncbi:Oligopeptide transport ATP-binding protein OppF [Pandoraea capi]|uniref:Oligopeptide transport ATP-binding protein OppF n=1 Tax=Pandoraea capi TaxID=2508286 RepID=A0ABY6VZ97_9BURK|nr:Oligopeptide transport ATP-binding protein OppF [Pandoraea capi]